MLNLAQSAVYNTIKMGNPCMWLSEPAEGKTFVALRLLEEMGGVIFTSNVHKANDIRRVWPTFRVKTYKDFDVIRGIPPKEVVVFDDWTEYDYLAHQKMLEIWRPHSRTLFLSRHWSRSSVVVNSLEMIYLNLKNQGVRTFST